MNHQKHCEECTAYLGKSFEEVHKWLDKFYNPENPPEHRKQRHHKQGIRKLLTECSERDTDESELCQICAAAVIHLLSDLYGPREFSYVKREYANERDYNKMLERMWKEKLIFSEEEYLRFWN